MTSNLIIDKNDLGKQRYNFLKKVEKDFKNNFQLQSLYAPSFPDDQRRKGMKKLLGKTKEERSADLYLMFSASVENNSFTKVIGFLSPVPTKAYAIFQEYNYLILVPHKIDSTIVFLEKRGFSSKKGFFTINYNVESKTISETDLFKQASASSLGFSISEYLQRLRFELSLEKETDKIIKEKEMSNICEKLNNTKDLSNKIKNLVASSEARMGNVYLKNPIGVTSILYPSGDNTLVQIGDFRLNPKTAFEILNQICTTLSSI